MRQIRVSSFNVSYNGISRVLTSEAHIYQAFLPEDAPKEPELKKYVAIWDTGATNTVITEKVVAECNLSPISMAEVHTASGTHLTNVYLVSLWLPSKVCIPQLRVTEGILSGNVEILIGMDVINSGDFAVTNCNGKTNMSFRMPSMECIDFVKKQTSPMNEINKKQPKVGRNDPCPCGSGKKYKHCCGR